MGKFLKKIQSSAITGVYSTEQTAVMNHYKDQPNNGPTIYAFENPETKATRTAFVNSDNYDDITDFTWRFGYNNGHPCIFITFSAIHPNLKQNGIICLETNSAMRHNKNQTINVFAGQGIGNGYLNINNENITWMYCRNIEIGKEIHLYISGKITTKPTICQAIKGPWRIALNVNHTKGSIPTDWIIKLNIRPTFRIENSSAQKFQNYMSYKALTDYKEIEYYYNLEF